MINPEGQDGNDQRVFCEGERGRGFYFEWDGHRIALRESKTWKIQLSSHDIKKAKQTGKQISNRGKQSTKILKQERAECTIAFQELTEGQCHWTEWVRRKGVWDRLESGNHVNTIVIVGVSLWKTKQIMTWLSEAIWGGTTIGIL